MQEVERGVYVEQDVTDGNLVVLTLDRGVVLMNIPLHPNRALAWVRQMEQQFGPIDHIILPDARPDAILVAALFSIPTIASIELRRRIDTYDDRSWRDFLQEMSTRYADAEVPLHALRLRRPTIALTSEIRLHRTYEQSPLTLHLEAVNGAYSGSLWLYIPELALLCAGPTVSLDTPPVLEATPDFTAWLHTLETLLRRDDVRTLIPGTGHAPAQLWEVGEQVEFMRVLQQTAKRIARGTHAMRLTASAQDLGQSFYNRAGRPGVARIRAGLQRLVEEMKE